MRQLRIIVRLIGVITLSAIAADLTCIYFVQEWTSALPEVFSVSCLTMSIVALYNRDKSPFTRSDVSLLIISSTFLSCLNIVFILAYYLVPENEISDNLVSFLFDVISYILFACSCIIALLLELSTRIVASGSDKWLVPHSDYWEFSKDDALRLPAERLKVAEILAHRAVQMRKRLW